jgi:hypothetical protein
MNEHTAEKDAGARRCPDCGNFMVYGGLEGYWCDLCIPSTCSGRHPVTGNPCVEAVGHEGLHRAMGTQRMQGFGAEATCPIPPGEGRT